MEISESDAPGPRAGKRATGRPSVATDTPSLRGLPDPDHQPTARKARSAGDRVEPADARAYAAAAGAIRTGRCARATEARQRLRFASRCGMATLVAAILSAVSKATRLGSGRSITIVATS